jgi:hypothetical protein
MIKSFTLIAIEQSTGIPLERLRYVVDSRILPGWRSGRASFTTSHGRGTPRTFTPFSAFAIAVTVLMLDGGMRRQMVQACLDLLADYGVPGSRDVHTVPLYQAFSLREISGLEIGDSVNVRLVASNDHDKKQPIYPWVQVQTRAEVRDYEPLVAIRINVTKLRACLGK